MNSGICSIIEKWYKKIGFPTRYDEEFYEALSEIEVDPNSVVEDYDYNCQDGRKNFLSYLYFCEKLESIYKEKGIGEDILLDTLSDFPRWLDTWTELHGGKLFLGELEWLSFHLTARLFKLGRLQFCMLPTQKDIPNTDILAGDKIVDIHIPAAGPLLIPECEKSLGMARAFFEKYFPEYDYRYFMCHSWLLDETLERLLKPDSNILAFRSLFKIVEKDESFAALHYTFRWKMKLEELADFVPKSSFAKALKEHVLAGGKLYNGRGIIEK